MFKAICSNLNSYPIASAVAGKTTLLKILAALQDYDSGDVQIGSSTHPFDPSRDIGMVFQQALLLK
jgi:NitT/TauT family transport system ATP-binding protein